MQNIKKIISKYLVSIPGHVLVLIAIVIIGIFLRTYNFEEWLFFQGDQARDAFLVSQAVEEGPGWLPLLGPKAGGTFLRLGPIFYYFEYVSASIFGIGSPAVFAYPDLLFSILTLGLLYLFLKELFPRSWSLVLTFGYSVCYFAIQYSRFAWNPNSLPFFNLLFFYALFKFFNADEKKNKILWSIVIGISYAVASQLHFVSFLVFPLVIAIIFVVEKFYFKKNIGSYLKYLSIALLVFVVFYVPVILSDVLTHGNNALNFLDSIGEKSSDSSFVALLLNNYFNFSKYFLTILGGLVNVSRNLINWFGVSIVIGTISGFIFLIKEKNEKRKSLIFLVLVWFFAYFLTYISLADKLQPRHFLVILPIPFIFLGFVAIASEKFFDFKYKFIIPFFLFMIPIVANAHSMKTWFGEMGDSQIMVTTPRKSAMLKSVQGESWWHLEETAKFISNDCKKKKILIIPPKEIYRGLYDYALQSVGEEREHSTKWGTIDVSSDICYYFVYFTKNNYFERYYTKQIEKLDGKSFGDLTVVHFEINKDNLGEIRSIVNPFKKMKSAKEIVAQEERDNDSEENDSISENPSQATSGGDSDDLNGSSTDGILEKLENIGNGGRLSRVFWRDLFN